MKYYNPQTRVLVFLNQEVQLHNTVKEWLQKFEYGPYDLEGLCSITDQYTTPVGLRLTVDFYSDQLLQEFEHKLTNRLLEAENLKRQQEKSAPKRH